MNPTRSMNARPVNQITQNLNSLQQIPVQSAAAGAKGFMSVKVIIIAVVGVFVLAAAAVVPATVYALTRDTSSTIVTTATTATTVTTTSATTTTATTATTTTVTTRTTTTTTTANVTSSATTVTTTSTSNVITTTTANVTSTSTTATMTSTSNVITTTTTTSAMNNPCLSNGLRWNMTGITIISGSQYSSIAGMYFDANDNLYFIDETPNHVVWRLAKNATNATLVAGTYRSHGVNATQFEFPQELYVDSRQTMFVTDYGNHRLQKFINGSRIGITAAGISGVNGSATNRLNGPAGLWFDPTETFMYIVDTDNHRVVRFSTNASSGSNGVVVAGGNGPANTNTSLNGPFGIYSVASVSNDLYITNTLGSSVMRWTPGASSGTFVAGIPGVMGSNASTLFYPMGIKLDTYQNLYVADFGNNRVQLFCHNSRVGITIAGDGNPGSTYTRLWYPKNIAFDSAMNLYVSDFGNNRIQKFLKL